MQNLYDHWRWLDPETGPPGIISTALKRSLLACASWGMLMRWEGEWRWMRRAAEGETRGTGATAAGCITCMCVCVCTCAGGVSLICELTSGVLRCYRKHLSPGPPLSLLADRRCLHPGPVICLPPCWVVAQSSLPFLIMAPQLTLSSLQLIRLLSQRFILNSLQSPPA